MIRTAMTLALLVGVSALAGTAMGVTITNYGLTPQEVTVKIGEGIEKIILQPNEARDDICPAPKGCVISHASGDEFPLKGTEEVDVDETGLSIPE